MFAIVQWGSRIGFLSAVGLSLAWFLSKGLGDTGRADVIAGYIPFAVVLNVAAAHGFVRFVNISLKEGVDGK